MAAKTALEGQQEVDGGNERWTVPKRRDFLCCHFLGNKRGVNEGILPMIAVRGGTSSPAISTVTIDGREINQGNGFARRETAREISGRDVPRGHFHGDEQAALGREMGARLPSPVAPTATQGGDL